jgi:hypothetical protein
MHGGVFMKPAGGAVVAIARDGAALPGTGGGTIAAGSASRIDGPWLNNNGDVAFRPESISGGAPTTGPCSGAGCDESVFIKKVGMPLDWLVLIGTVTPWGTIDRIGIGRPGLNNKQVGFKLSFGGTASAVIGFTRIDDHDIINLCAKTGDPLPLATGTFEGFSDPAFGANGTLVFHGDVLVATGVEKTNIYLCYKAFFPGGSDTAVATQGNAKLGGGTFGPLEEASIAPGGGKEGPVVFVDDIPGNIYLAKS